MRSLRGRVSQENTFLAEDCGWTGRKPLLESVSDRLFMLLGKAVSILAL